MLGVGTVNDVLPVAKDKHVWPDCFWDAAEEHFPFVHGLEDPADVERSLWPSGVVVDVAISSLLPQHVTHVDPLARRVFIVPVRSLRTSLCFLWAGKDDVAH